MGCGGSKDAQEVEGQKVVAKNTPAAGLTATQMAAQTAAEEAAAAQAAAEQAAKEAAEAAERARIAEEAAALERARIRGCYLVFNEVAQGTMQMVWSETKVEGALAQFTTQEGVPGAGGKKVPQHKFQTNGGRSDLIKGVGTGASSGKNTLKLLNGFAQFVKNAQQWEAAIVQLTQLDYPGGGSQPVSIFLLSADPNLSDANIVRMDLGEYVDSPSLEAMQAVAVFNEPAGTDKMKAKYMEIKSFTSFVEGNGASCIPLAAQKKKAPGLRGKTSADLMEKLAKQSDKAAATEITTSGAAEAKTFGIGNTVKTASMEDAKAQAMLNANAGGADKAGALKAHGAMMGAAAGEDKV